MATPESADADVPGREYPATPAGWRVTASRGVGPFTTHVTWRRPDGRLVEWSSRRHRKGRSRLSHHREGVWWAPRRASWWIGILFAIGSTCFLVAPFPGFVELVGSGADGMVFFVGSIFFTSAATLQWLETINVDPGSDTRHARFRVFTFEPHRIDWWACGVLLIGTLFFNVTTFQALQSGLDAHSYDKLVWRPDAAGCICFLVSGYLAYAEVCGDALWTRQRSLDWKIAAWNLVGCVAFGIAAIASYWVPSQGSVLDLAADNAFTAFGGLCFLVGSVLMLPESAAARAEASGVLATEQAAV